MVNENVLRARRLETACHWSAMICAVLSVIFVVLGIVSLVYGYHVYTVLYATLGVVNSFFTLVNIKTAQRARRAAEIWERLG